MASNIGIKIANGEFYPLIEENSSIKKRLILTTVHDDQPSVQIDLYRSSSSTMTDAQYVGSLVVEKIKPKPKGDPSIEMVISSNSGGEIMADAIDLDTTTGAEHYTLTVSLKSLDETSRDMEIPD
jgi:molecular chaperone DnaK (HSP70)